jgi:hypothetical protein
LVTRVDLRHAVQRRTRDGAAGRGDDPGKVTLAEGLPRQDRGAPEIVAPVHRWVAPTVAVDAESARDHGLVQFDPSARPDRDDPSRIHAAAEAGLRDGGAALPHRDAIQRSFGHHDVGDVVAHIGGAAADAAAGMGALAYASGDRVAFARDPDLHLAAHEAAHVVQQRGGVRLAGGVGQDGDAFERHADEVADLVVRGEPAEAALDRYAHRGTAGGRAVQRRGGGGGAPGRRAGPPRARDGQPIREGDVLLPGSVGGGTGSQPAPDTHRAGAATVPRNASVTDEGQRNPDFAPSAQARPPLNPYEGDYTVTDNDAPLFHDGPGYQDPQQGALGDCYLIASLSAVAQMDPARIRRMVRPLGDGRYVVTFWVARREGEILTYNPHDEIVTNEIPSAGMGRMPVYAGTAPRRGPEGTVLGQRELWVSLVERAYAQWRGSYPETGAGANAAIALEEITGTSSQRLDPRQTDPDEVIRAVEQALRAGHPVVASTGPDDAAAGRRDLFGAHAYSVLSAGSGRMLLRNQHYDPQRAGRRVSIDAAALRECFVEIAISGATAGRPVRESPG